MRWLSKVLGVSLVGWLVWRLFGPDVAPDYRGVQERPMRIPGRTVFIGRKELFVREAGPESAPVIVLVHGWGFDGEMTYFRLMPLLARRFRVVAPDLRSHGKSDNIRGRFEIDDLADELAGVLDAVGVTEPIALFGYSMGGLVAQAFTRRYPGRVRSLVLGATAAYPIARKRYAVRTLFWFARAVARVSKKESARFSYRFLLKRRIIDPQHGRWIWEALLNRDPTLYYESGNAVWRFDSRAWVGRLGVPTLVIIPTDDTVMPITAQEELAVLLDDAEVCRLEGSGHEAVLSRADDFAVAIEQFIEALVT